MKLNQNDLVITPDGEGIVEADDGNNCLVKFLPEHGEWRAPCEFRIYKTKELEIADNEN
jgi:hypothetical protein